MTFFSGTPSVLDEMSEMTDIHFMSEQEHILLCVEKVLLPKERAKSGQSCLGVQDRGSRHFTLVRTVFTDAVSHGNLRWPDDAHVISRAVSCSSCASAENEKAAVHLRLL